jgi:segregation and condensation protein B
VRKLLKEKAAKRLSIQALECLAIISYRQPITKAEIESVRGVLSDGAMKTLLERRMVTIVGRSEKAGRPLLYGTTKEYLAYFGLKGLTDLPRMEEFEALAREKMGDIAEELDKMQSDRVAAQAAEAASAEDGLPVIEKPVVSETAEDEGEAELIAAAAAQECPDALPPEELDPLTDDAAPGVTGEAPEEVPT